MWARLVGLRKRMRTWSPRWMGPTPSGVPVKTRSPAEKEGGVESRERGGGEVESGEGGGGAGSGVPVKTRSPAGQGRCLEAEWKGGAWAPENTGEMDGAVGQRRRRAKRRGCP
jgi:hypothetical protein